MTLRSAMRLQYKICGWQAGCISEEALVVSVSDHSGVDQVIQEHLGRGDGIRH